MAGKLGSKKKPENPESAGPPLISHLRKDDIVALVLLIFVATAYGITATFESVPSSLSLNQPPEFFPRLVLLAIAALTLAMVIEARRRPEKKRKEMPRMVYYSALSLLAFLLVIDWLGMFLSMVFFCGLFPLLWGERRYRIIIPFMTLFPATVYLLFVKVLEVRFPPGVVFEWMGF